jgi:hypothetical protein
MPDTNGRYTNTLNRKVIRPKQQSTYFFLSKHHLGRTAYTVKSELTQTSQSVRKGPSNRRN